MGGCKCIFRDCQNKSSNNSTVHFFHFPVKHPEKLKKWVKYADAENILKLGQNQAKNRVVCSAHFRDECFMNYKKNRITQTAIPTLVVLYEDEEGKVALDYETSDCPEPVRISPTTAKHLVPPKPKDPEEKPIINNKRILNGQELNAISTKKLKLEAGENFNLKIIEDQNDSENCENLESNLDESDGVLKINLVELEVTENVHENHEINAVCLNDKELKSDENGENSLEKSTENSQEVEENSKTQETEVIVSKNVLRKHTIKVLGNTIKKLKSDSKAQIESFEQELKHKDLEINKLKNQVKSLAEQDKQNKTLPVLNKEQLFNTIKKYLCPSMSSLVRMEMFGNPEREWKDDEKDVAVELLQLGETVFSYFRDEWRFRLPPQKDVEQWLQEK